MSRDFPVSPEQAEQLARAARERHERFEACIERAQRGGSRTGHDSSERRQELAKHLEQQGVPKDLQAVRMLSEVSNATPVRAAADTGRSYSEREIHEQERARGVAERTQQRVERTQQRERDQLAALTASAKGEPPPPREPEKSDAQKRLEERTREQVQRDIHERGERDKLLERDVGTFEAAHQAHRRMQTRDEPGRERGRERER